MKAIFPPVPIRFALLECHQASPSAVAATKKPGARPGFDLKIGGDQNL